MSKAAQRIWATSRRQWETMSHRPTLSWTLSQSLDTPSMHKAILQEMKRYEDLSRQFGG